MRAMQPGQQVFFYHSNCKPPGIVGVMEVAQAAYTDHTQFERSSKYFDEKSKKEDPRWSMVDVKFVRFLELQELPPANSVLSLRSLHCWHCPCARTHRVLLLSVPSQTALMSSTRTSHVLFSQLSKLGHGVQVRKLKRQVTLDELKALREENSVAAGLQLFTTARLSVQNVSQAEWDLVHELEKQPAP